MIQYLVLAISTGIEAAVVTKPEIIELAKCNTIFSSKYPLIKRKKYNIININSNIYITLTLSGSLL